MDFDSSGIDSVPVFTGGREWISGWGPPPKSGMNSGRDVDLHSDGARWESGEHTRIQQFLPKLSSLISGKSQTTHTHNNRGVEFLPSWNENHDLGVPRSFVSRISPPGKKDREASSLGRLEGMAGKFAGGRKSKLVVDWPDSGSSR